MALKSSEEIQSGKNTVNIGRTRRTIPFCDAVPLSHHVADTC
jgi:hypothetical protein